MKKATNPLALDLRAGGFGVFPIAKLFDLPSNVWYPSILRKCAFDCPRLECREPETRGIPIFCNPEKRCLSRRRTCKHLTSCFAKSFLELETAAMSKRTREKKRKAQSLEQLAKPDEI